MNVFDNCLGASCLGAMPFPEPAIARNTRGAVPGLWDPRRVDVAWPEPIDDARVAYTPGLGAVLAANRQILSANQGYRRWLDGYAGPFSGIPDPGFLGLGQAEATANGGGIHVGEETDVPSVPAPPQSPPALVAPVEPAPPPGVDLPAASREPRPWPDWYRALSTVGAIQGAYHGYKRNDSVGWAFGWFILGGIVPFFTIPLSFAQGFPDSKRKK